MTMYRKALFFLLIFFGVYFANAQKKWSLTDCIQYALEHNIQLKQKELNTQIQENILRQSKFNLAPSLNASTSRNFSLGRRVDPYTNQFTDKTTTNDNVSINSQVTLFAGFQKINSIKKNKLDLKVSLAELDKLKNDISLNITSAYLSVLFNTEILKTTKKQLELTQKQLNRTKKLVNAGSLAKSNLLETKAQLSNEELQVVNYENQLSISLLNLKQILELDTLRSFEIVQPEVSIENVNLPLNADDIYKYAKKNLPQLLSAQYRLESLKQSLAIAKGGRSPRLTLDFGYGTGYSEARKIYNVEGVKFSPDGGYATDGTNQYMTYSASPIGSFKTKSFSDQITDNQNTYAILSLSIPIFNHWSVNTQISNTKINVLNAQYSLEFEEKQLYKEIQQKYLDAISAHKKYVATESSLKSAEESYNYTQQKFDVGAINILDYNISKNRVIKTRSNLLQAKYEYLFAVKILDFYQGKIISL